MAETSVKVEERNGSKVVCVSLGGELSPETEAWFADLLMKMRGVAYLEFTEKSMRRLDGYGVWLYAWPGFRLRLEAAIREHYEQVEVSIGGR